MTILGYFLLHWVMSKCMFFIKMYVFLSKSAVFVKMGIFVKTYVFRWVFCRNMYFCHYVRFCQNVFVSSEWAILVKMYGMVKFTFAGQKGFFCENAILYKCAFLSNDNFVLFSAILCNFVRLCAILTKSAFFVLLFQNVVLPILVLPKFWSFLYLFFLYLRLLFLFILFLSLPSFGLPIFAHPIFVTSYIRSS